MRQIMGASQAPRDHPWWWAECSRTLALTLRSALDSISHFTCADGSRTSRAEIERRAVGQWRIIRSDVRRSSDGAYCRGVPRAHGVVADWSPLGTAGVNSGDSPRARHASVVTWRTASVWAAGVATGQQTAPSRRSAMPCCRGRLEQPISSLWGATFRTRPRRCDVRGAKDAAVRPLRTLTLVPWLLQPIGEATLPSYAGCRRACHRPAASDSGVARLPPSRFQVSFAPPKEHWTARPRPWRLSSSTRPVCRLVIREPLT
jgi:hypothetical protein